MTNLAYDRRGTGTPLVLIHGIGSRWQVWQPVLDLLAEHKDVISIDLPGFGASAPDPSVDIGVPGYAVRVAEFLDELGVQAPEVGGNSMGGGIAIELGRMGVASRVSCFSPIGFWTPLELRWCRAVFKSARPALRRLRPRLPALAEHAAVRIAIAGLLFGHPSRLDPTTFLADVDGLIDAPDFDAALDAFNRYDIRSPVQDWGKLRDVPVRIAWGSRDALLIYKTQSARARSALPWAEHVTLHSCGHVPFYDDPWQCARVLVSEPKAQS